jgi:valyl-tRNA synthetase
MDSTLAKTYDFRSTEKRIYDWWERNGYFKPANDPAHPDFDPGIKPFVISIPPPNVTGELHLGHAMFVAMEDLMIRYNRMKGVPALWVPGTDHAGIATQLQVEKSAWGLPVIGSVSGLRSMKVFPERSGRHSSDCTRKV